MTINKSHLKYREFISNEIITFNKLGSDPRLAKIAKGFTVECRNFYHANKKISNAKYPIKLCRIDFGVNFDLLFEKREHKVLLEVLIEPDFDECSYALSICNSEDTLIRKFHFDYAPLKTSKDKKPFYHLQYGGEPTPQIKELKLKMEHMFSHLSIPRLDVAPMNLAIFVDTVFCELNYIASHDFVEHSLWRDVVKSNEEKILKPYYQNLHAFFQGHSVKCLYRDFKYGQEQ